MKFITTLLTTILLAATCFGQSPRDWTNKEGKTVRGKMIAKTDSTVTIRVVSKKYTLQLDTLSEEDQQYVKSTEISTPIDFSVKTTKQSSKTDTTKSTRTIKVSIGRLRGREVTVKVYWIGEGNTRETIGLYKTVTRRISEDGDHEFDVIFERNYGDNEYDDQHKAHIVILEDSDGKEIDRYESIKGFSDYAN